MSEIAPTSGEFIVFLPAGGATAGQWPINRPNIAGLGLQQNEDSVRNHLINDREHFSISQKACFDIFKLLDSRIIT